MKDKVDSQLRQQLDAAIKRFDEAFNKNDSAVFAALFTEDAVLVTETGPLYGREAIEEHHRNCFTNAVSIITQGRPTSIRLM